MRLDHVFLAIALVAAAGCSEQTAPTAVPPRAPNEPSRLMFFDSSQGITVADDRGAVLAADTTAASPDWSRLYAVRGSDLVSFHPAANRDLARVTVPGRLTARVVSTSGRLVALTADTGRHDSTYRPTGKKRTTIVVADPSGRRAPRRLTLSGNFEPEAFATDDRYLFVLEYLPATAPERYRVRRVDLASGQVQPLLLRDKRVVPPGAEEEMRGEGRQAVLSPDRTRLYTLYLHQGDHQHTRDLLPGRHGAGGRTVHAFVHVLSLKEGWAFCLDLPDPFGRAPAGTHTLTISPDGGTLYVAEMSTKRVVTADTERLAVTNSAGLRDDHSTGGGAAMSTSPDGATLYIGSSNVVRLVESTTLRVIRTWTLPMAVRGVAVSRDGRRVYAGQSGRIAELDVSSGQVLRTLDAAGLLTLRHVLDR